MIDNNLMFWISMGVTAGFMGVVVWNIIFGRPNQSRLTYNIILEQERQAAHLKRLQELATMERSNTIYKDVKDDTEPKL